MQAYGFNLKMTESECVAELFKLYEKLAKQIVMITIVHPALLKRHHDVTLLYILKI